MKHRNVMAVVLYSIITLGIYDLFWLVNVKKELNAKTDIHTPTMWLLFAPFLAFLIPIGLLLALGSSSNSNNTSLVNTFVALIYAIAFLLILPVTFYWFFKFSKAVSRYTSGELNTAVTFLLLWMLRFIGLAIIQDKFNDMIAAGVNGPAPAGSVGAASFSEQPSSQPKEPAVPSAPTVDAPVDPNGPAATGPVATAEPEAPADDNQPPQAPAA